MSIEGGTSGGGGGPGGVGSVSVGPAISVGPSIGPSMGGFSFGGEMGSLSIGSSIVNEGPVGSSFSLAEFKPLGIPGSVQEGPLTPLSLGIEKNAAPIPAFDVIAEAESIIAQAPKPAILEQNPLNAEFVVAEAGYWPGMIEPVTEEVRLPLRQPIPQISPLPELMPLTVIQPGTRTVIEEAEAIVQQAWKSYPVTQPEATTNNLEEEELVVLSNTVPEQIEEKVLVKENKEAESEIKDREESSLMRIKIVKAVEISEKRKSAIRSAVRRAGSKGIVGKSLIRLISDGFWESKSPIAKEGKDWTIDLTVKAIEANTTEYNDEEEAEQAYIPAVDKNIPLMEGKSGRVATIKEVSKVLNGEDENMEIFKSKTPAEIVIKRVVKKRMEISSDQQPILIPVSEKIEIRPEGTSLEELGLSEVFQKAA